MAKILVIGGAGYIGSHVAKALSKNKRNQVMIFDDLSTGFRSLARYGRFVKGSLQNAKAIERCLKTFRPQAIYHFANFALVGESVKTPEKYYVNNMTGTLNLLQAMRSTKNKSPIIFSSSCAVYGEPVARLDESHPRNPVNPYGVCKRNVEDMLADFSRAYGIPYVALRYFNAAGADPEGEIGEMHEPETHLIPRLAQLFQGKESKKDKIQIWGDDYNTPDGTCVRDYVHIVDLAAAHVRALDYLRDGGESRAVNLGSAQGYSVREIISMMQQVTGKIVSVPVGPRRPGDPAKLVAVNDLAKSLWDWQPKLDLENMVWTAWQWANRARK